jgi:hypothetical protein
MQTGEVLSFPLFHRENSSAKVSELAEFLLDGLEPFMPLAVSDLSRCFAVALTPILIVQFLKVCDLGAEMPDFFTKNC